MELNIQAMLQTSIAIGLVCLVGVLGFYAWLKHTGQLKGKDRHEEKIRHN